MSLAVGSLTSGSQLNDVPGCAHVFILGFRVTKGVKYHSF